MCNFCILPFLGSILCWDSVAPRRLLTVSCRRCLGKALCTNTGVFWQRSVCVVREERWGQNSLPFKRVMLLRHYKQAIIASVKPTLTTHQSFQRGKNCQSLEELQFILQSCDKNKLRNKFLGRAMLRSLSLFLLLSISSSLSTHLCSDTQCWRV